MEQQPQGPFGRNQPGLRSVQYTVSLSYDVGLRLLPRPVWCNAVVPKHRRAVVLVVEDEVLVRMNAMAIVEDAGFDVVEAANADEAIRILEIRDDIGVVFTDIEMPGSMDGLRLASAIRGRWPPIELIVTSGRRIPSDDDLPERGHFIPKPYGGFQVEQLLNKLMAD